jgi:putative transposase
MHIHACLKLKIGNLGVGYNKGWKQQVNIGRRNTQNFQSIPFANLVGFLKYKCEQEGINFKSGREDHTSKCSALDFEPIEHHDKYMGKRAPPMKGKKSKKEQ